MNLQFLHWQTERERGWGGGGCIQKDTKMQLDQIQAGRERGRVYKELQKEMNSDHMQVRGGEGGEEREREMLMQKGKEVHV